MAWCIVVLALVAAGCGVARSADGSGDDQAGTDSLSIVATTTIMGDIARNVAPDTAEISVLMEAGADPHTFEPSARQVAQLQDADLVIANGGGLEAGLGAALADAAAADVPVFSAMEHISTLTGDEHDDEESSTRPHSEEHDSEEHDSEEHDSEEHDSEEHDGEEHDSEEHAGDASATADSGDGHDHGAIDPHFWMDPVRMSEAVEVLGTRIGELTDTSQRSADRASRYVAQLRDLDRRIVDLLDDIPDDRRIMVTNHAALAYFADRYDLRIVGTVIPSTSTGAEPSARDIEQLAETLRREDVSVIFADSTAPRRLAETLAGEVGPDTRIVELFTGSIGDEEADGPGSYVDMLMIDAERISEALL